MRHRSGLEAVHDAQPLEQPRDVALAYLARYLAANVVDAGLARRCRIGLAYAIGRAEPVWLDVECFGTERAEPASIATTLRETVDLRVGAVIERLALRTTPLRPTATFGHFGRPAENFGWELRDLGPQLLERCGDTSIAGR
ncbi:S-adenosylmethionine synthetase [Catenulispora sp. GAS73]|uniref:methionine adenosyltransferase domain-containing protein n=1 Tax=Catenulispora sp. GAS73 TaxID=3156269 RepID=UPI0035131257